MGWAVFTKAAVLASVVVVADAELGTFAGIIEVVGAAYEVRLHPRAGMTASKATEADKFRGNLRVKFTGV